MSFKILCWPGKLFYIFLFKKKKIKLYFYSYLKLGFVILESYQILIVGSPQGSVEIFRQTQPTFVLWCYLKVPECNNDIAIKQP